MKKAFTPSLRLIWAVLAPTMAGFAAASCNETVDWLLDALAVLNEAFAESDLPWKVDVVDWTRMSDAFRLIVEQGRVVLQRVEEAGEDGRELIRDALHQRG